ncbi:MAG: hypothetical protein E4H14_07960 [Candidatus Thorarchaeota archaeon]|nr:MAG: hypothetical protein E4H14_07960 [Candidatus Thorarchaeota archaeon]
MDEDIEFSSSYDECEDKTSELPHFEEKETKVRDCKVHSLTSEERDEIIRKYNIEYAKSKFNPRELQETKKYAVNMWVPELDGVRVESYDHLVELLKSRSPVFFKRKDADKLLKDARLHIELYQEYGNREYLEKGEVAALSKKLKKSPITLKRYLREGVMPKVYYWSNMVPSAERERKLEDLLSRLNGVTTEKEYDRRFSTLYFYDEMSTTADHIQKDEFARKFFEFIREYGESGFLVDLAKRLGIGKSTISAWFDGIQLPTRIAFATLIPQESPRVGFKWLPKKLNHITNLPENFIQVPLKITSQQDLLDVLGQLTPLESKAMREYEKEMGEVSQAIAFMYLLGLMVSDGGFKSDVDYSAKVELFVSKKYSWGSTLGKGFCYTLGKVGVSAKRDSDQEKVKENGKIIGFRKYSSEASPLLMWMKKVLLGLKISEIKKSVAINADWILNIPHEWKVAFIQGLADGDGYASIPRFDTAITTTTNEKFFAKLLSSIGIEATTGDNRARIKKHDEILKARELPLFKFARGRQQILDDMCKIIELKPKGRRRIPEDERKLVMELYRTGLKPWEIVEKLWHDQGLARTTGMIYSLIQKENKKNVYDE